MRLDKLLAHMNYGSRKEVKNFIRKGYVFVNGEVIKDDDFKVDEAYDDITILNEEVKYKTSIYYMLHKPKGYVCANIDTKDPTVFDLVNCPQKGIFTVGRLDKDTTGLLLLTNDGELAHELLSPKYHVKKVYEVVFQGDFQDAFFKRFAEGIVLEDGYLCKPAQFELLEPQRGKISIFEGKYHQIKRMFQMLGLEVMELKRISFGTLYLPDTLSEGNFRELFPEEIESLKRK